MRLKEQEQHIQQMAATREFPDVASEVKTCYKEDNFGNENNNTESNNNILRTSNRLKTRNDSLNLNEMARKKRVSRTGETESNNGDDTHMKEKRIRKSDPPKVFNRVLRPTRPTTSGSSNQQVTQKRISNREQPQVPGRKERESRKKIWS